MADKKDDDGEIVPVDPKEIIASLRRLRGTHKREITIVLKKLSELKEKNELPLHYVRNKLMKLKVK